MNTLKTKYSILILILALTFGTQARAEKDSTNPDKKEIVRIKLYAPIMSYISEYFDVDDSIAMEVVYNEEFESKQLEAWMFEPLRATEEEPKLEAWMFDTEYYSK